MKSHIVPAILEESFENADGAVSRVADVAEVVQIDIVDGIYAPHTTWPFTTLKDDPVISGTNKDLLKEMQHLSSFKIPFEIDLMTQNPEDLLGLWLVTDAVRFIVHRMSTKYLTFCVNRIKDDGREVYVGLTSDDTPKSIESVADSIDGVQCMGIAQIGKQGEPYDERIETLIAAIRDAYPDLLIQIDGGVSVQTIPRLSEAGATRFAVGSALFTGDAEKNFSDLENAYSEAKAVV